MADYASKLRRTLLSTDRVYNLRPTYEILAYYLKVIEISSHVTATILPLLYTREVWFTTRRGVPSI